MNGGTKAPPYAYNRSIIINHTHILHFSIRFPKTP